jgi:butyryl-CoA dehydrogenase
MNIDLTSEQQLIRESMLKWAQGSLTSSLTFDDAIDALTAQGLFSICVQEQYGGAGADLTSGLLSIEAIAHVNPSLALNTAMHTIILTDLMQLYGGDTQKQHWLPKLAAGQALFCVPLLQSMELLPTPMQLNSDECTFMVSGSGHQIVYSEKAAGLALALEDQSHAALLIAECDHPALEFHRNRQLAGMQGLNWHQVKLTDYPFHQERIFTAKNGQLLNQWKILEALSLAAVAVGMMQSCLTMALEYAQQRQQFGQPIASFQLIQAKLADIYAHTELTHLLLYQTASLDYTERTLTDALSCLNQAAHAVEPVTEQTLQIFGGYGYIRDFTIERFWRDAKFIRLLIGGSQQLSQQIAKALIRQQEEA